MKQMRAWLKNANTIKMRLFVTYAVVLAVLLAASSGMIVMGIETLLVQQLGEARIEVLKQIGERSNSIKNTSLTISNLFGYNTTLLACLQEPAGQPGNSATQAYLDSIKEEYDIVFGEIGVGYDVVVLGNNGFNYSSRAGRAYDFDSIKTQLWYLPILESGEEVVYVTSFDDHFAFDDDPAHPRYVFSIARNLFSSTGEQLGVLLTNIDEQVLFSLTRLQYEGEENNIYIVDQKGNVVTHREKSSLGLNFISMEHFETLYGFGTSKVFDKLGEEYLLCSYLDEQTGWLIISEVPLRTILGPLDAASKIVYAVMVAGIVAALLLSAYISRSISSPLEQLCGAMAEVEKGNLDVLAKIHGYGEVNQLQASFNSMAARIRGLLDEVRLREENKRRIELDFLRAQINPHFLYNTLFSIRCLVETGQNSKATSMMDTLVDLLKQTLSADNKLVTLAEECETTQTYCRLQHFRYGDEVTFEADLDKDTLDCMVPPLILQPVVENAFFHGLEPMASSGTIVVESHREEERLVITVSDDGAGMDGVTARRLETQTEHQDVQGSIGIPNVVNRIKVNFGSHYGIRVVSKEGVGTTIRLEMPFIRQQYYEEGAAGESADCGR